MAGSERTEGAVEAGTATSAATRAQTSTFATGAEAWAHERFAGEAESIAASIPSGPEATAPTLEALRVSCLMNSRYHASREAFLDTVHRWFMFAVIALGAGALIDVFPREMSGYNIGSLVKQVFAALAALIAALDLTFDLSNRARTHSMMKRRYFELIADVVEKKRTLIEACACLNRYSADEEPAYHALLISSWNAAQEMVYGEEALCYDIPTRHLLFKNICRYVGEHYRMKPKTVGP
jgi:hypothetical protein